MYNIKKLIIICLNSLVLAVNSLTLGLQNGTRIHRQANFNNCSGSEDVSCETLVPVLSNRFPTEESVTSKNGCILPEHPILGEWSVYDSINTNLLPGMWVPAKTVLQIKCDTLYKLSGPAVILCTDGKWSSNISQCLRTCPPRYSTAGTKVMCTYKDNMVTENCTEAIDGTIARYECSPFYEHLGSPKPRTDMCRFGSWTQEQYECFPVCGQKPLRAETLIINGTNAKKDDYPWKVAIYRHEKKQLICGGTLISQRLIVTAAQCVTNFKGEKESKDIYNVAVGKYYRDYDDPRDADRAQFSTLQEIFIPEVYKGTNGNFFGDIAVLVTTKTFKISRIVQPVCVDWVEKYNIEHLNTSGNLYGYVTGWGFTTEGANASEELKELKVPIRDNKQCREAFPSNFNKYFTSDKICAGYLNQSASVCSGDSGNGLVIEHDARHYIAGIVSVAPKGLNGCNSQQYALYTNVAKYTSDFISGKDVQFGAYKNNTDQQDGEKCLLPEHPSNGQWSVVGSKLSAEPGTMISSTTTIHITCSKYHILNGPSLIQCKAGQWESRIGTCLAPCPPLTSTRSMEVNCNNDVNCMNATHGTLATFKCAPFYENLELNRNPFRTCQNGQWKPEVPICVPVCGIKPISTGRKQKPYYPWNVAVYEREGNNKNFKCAGSLVNDRVILTSAQCISDENGNQFPATRYMVAAGKSTENYEDSKDTQAQYSDIEEIFIPEDYKGNIRKYYADIAVLITKTSFSMTKRVQLVCVDWDNKLLKEFKYPKIKGYIAGPLASQQSLREVFEIEVPFINETQCNQQLTSFATRRNSNFDSSYFTIDKFCSGYINSDKTPLCKVNRGTGLVSKNRYDNKYYLTGIASIFPSIDSENCDNQRWVLFTQVSKHISNFILEKNKLYTPLKTPYLQSSCGVKSVKAQTLIVHGNNVTKGDYPWQVAIYRTEETSKVLICGGTLINQRIVLTAAHCVTDEVGSKFSEKLYTVAVGKYYRDYYHPDDKNAQFSSLIDIFVPDQYQGELQNYVGDIAVLITETSFVLSREVQPICVDWETKYETHILRPTATGFVTGWGFTKENSNPSQELKDLEVPYIEKELCKDQIAPDYNIYLTFDKMCSGYLNQSKTVCKGDSGGGLVFKNRIDGRYYIEGIVSLSPQSPTGGCDSQQFALYTKVGQYVKSFILKKVQLYWR